MKELFAHARHISRSSAARSSLLLYASELIFLGSGFLASLIVTRLLGPELYGVYSYVLGLAAFIAVFFEFGLHTTSARMLATTDELRLQSRFIGGFAWITLGLGVALAGVIAVVALLGLGVPEQYAASLLFIAPLTVILPFAFFFENVCQGTGRVRILSLYNAVINVVFLSAVAFLAWAGLFSLKLAMASYFGAVVVSTLVALFFLRPARSSLKEDWPTIKELNRRYGLKVFWGRVATIATYNLDKILIAAFSTPAAVGYYSLSYAIAQPLSLFSRAISFTLFREFSAARAVAPKVFKVNVLWISLSTLTLALAGYFLLEPIFGNAFSPAKPMLPILALAVAFQGLYEPYNKFIVARGEGRIVQRITFSSAAVNLLVNLALIYYYGAIGAAVASLFSMAFTFALYRREYHRLINSSV